MKCRWCKHGTATLSIRSGFENHPCCRDCADWWATRRHAPLSDVDSGYVFPEGGWHAGERARGGGVPTAAPPSGT